MRGKKPLTPQAELARLREFCKKYPAYAPATQRRVAELEQRIERLKRLQEKPDQHKPATPRSLSVSDVLAGLERRGASIKQVSKRSLEKPLQTRVALDNPHVPVYTPVPRVYTQAQPREPRRIQPVDPNDLPKETLSPRERDKLSAARSTMKSGRG